MDTKLLSRINEWKNGLNPVFPFDLKDEMIYNEHANLITTIGNQLLENEGKKFIVDENNKNILRFLLYYFNNCDLCEMVDVGDQITSRTKNIFLIGSPGTGKTLLMQIFSIYLKITQNPFRFDNIGITELINYHKKFGHINFHTYNCFENAKGKPTSYCINDLGLCENQKVYGTDMKAIIDEFLYSRYEIWLNTGIRYHVTSNMTVDELKKGYDMRLIDRFKAFNLLILSGKSRR